MNEFTQEMVAVVAEDGTVTYVPRAPEGEEVAVVQVGEGEVATDPVI